MLSHLLKNKVSWQSVCSMAGVEFAVAAACGSLQLLAVRDVDGAAAVVDQTALLESMRRSGHAHPAHTQQMAQHLMSHVKMVAGQAITCHE